MLQRRSPLKLGVSVLSLGAAALTAWIMLTSATVRSAQGPTSPKNAEGLSSPPTLNDQAGATTPKEKSGAGKSNIDRTRSDAAELSALADQLRDELKKMNVNVFPLDVLDKTQKLEKLARKIKGEAYEGKE